MIVIITEIRFAAIRKLTVAIAVIRLASHNRFTQNTRCIRVRIHGNHITALTTMAGIIIQIRFTAIRSISVAVSVTVITTCIIADVVTSVFYTYSIRIFNIFCTIHTFKTTCGHLIDLRFTAITPSMI